MNFAKNVFNFLRQESSSEFSVENFSYFLNSGLWTELTYISEGRETV